MEKNLTTRRITLSALLVAMSVIIGIFCKNFMNFGGGLFRVTFENFPIILSGFLFGPLVGGLVGVATDLVSYLLSAQIYPPNLIVTFGALMIGSVSGVVSRVLSKRSGYVRIIACCTVSHLIGSVIIKSIGLHTFYGIAVLWRIPLYIVITAVETSLMCMLYKNANFRSLIDERK